MNNVMLDIRTLGDHCDASILAIECVFFEPSTGKIGPQYYRAVDLNKAENIDPAAVIELLKGDSHQRAEIVNASCSEFDAIALFFDFIRQNTDQHCEPSFWSKKPVLVSQWLIHTSRRHKLGSYFVPHFPCCLSTLISVAGVTGYTPHPRRSAASYMLTDAFYQAEQVCEIWQRLTSPYIESL